LCLFHAGELVEGVVDGGIDGAPAPPGSIRLEHFQRIGQMLGLVPAIERRPVGGFGEFGTHHQQGRSHSGAPSATT